MNRKFVFESFEAYLEFSERENLPILEKETPKITEDEVKTLVQEILKKQKELLASKGKFKKYLSAEDPYGLWLKDWRNEPENKGKSYPLPGEGLNQFSAFAAVYLWDKLSEDQKQEIYTGIRIELKERGYTFNEIRKINQNRENLLSRPCILISPTDTVEEEEEKGEKAKFPVLSTESEGKLFKDNEWDLADSSFDPAQKEKLVQGIREVMGAYKTGKFKINSIDISSSSSRYRNTGNAESLSWGELSYNRAVTVAKIIGRIADEYGISEKEKTELQNLIKIDSKGTNGDGTSGPNPIDVKYGYYDKNSKFIENNKGFDNSRTTIVVSNLGPEGKPTDTLKTATLELDPTKEDYDKYKYSNVIIDGIKYIGDTTKPDYIKSINTEYTPGYLLPAKEGGNPPWSPPTNPFPRRGKTIGIPGIGTNPFRCPEL